MGNRKSARRLFTLGPSLEQLEPRVLLAADAGLGDGGYESTDLRYDSAGNAYYFDPVPADLDPKQPLPFPLAAPGDGESSLDVPVYHSNASAAKKIYLDFDGHIVSGTSWNSNNNQNPIHAPAYDFDGDIFSFSQTELDRVFEIWERVSEDFSPFDVDVTTEDPGTDFFRRGGQGVRILITTNVDDERLGGTGNQWFSAAGGVGYVNSWN